MVGGDGIIAPSRSRPVSRCALVTMESSVVSRSVEIEPPGAKWNKGLLKQFSSVEAASVVKDGVGDRGWFPSSSGSPDCPIIVLMDSRSLASS